MRVKHKVWVNTADDTGMEDLHYGPGETKRLVQSDAFGQWGGGSFSIADSANEDLDLGDVDNVKGIYFQVEGDVQIKINGSSDSIQLRRESATTGQVAKFFLEADLTQVNVVNDTGGTVVGHFHIWGTAT